MQTLVISIYARSSTGHRFPGILPQNFLSQMEKQNELCHHRDDPGNRIGIKENIQLVEFLHPEYGINPENPYSAYSGQTDHRRSKRRPHAPQAPAEHFHNAAGEIGKGDNPQSDHAVIYGTALTGRRLTAHIEPQKRFSEEAGNKAQKDAHCRHHPKAGSGDFSDFFGLSGTDILPYKRQGRHG